MKLRLIIGLLTVVLLSGCSAWEKAYEQAGSSSFQVISIKGPSSLGLIKAMEPSIKPTVRLGDTVQYTFEKDESELYTQLLEGKMDMAVVPTEMAAKLYNDRAEYQLAAVNTGGYLYVVTDDKSITGFSDLKGKVVQIAGENSATDLILRYLLKENGIEPEKDLTLQYATSEEALVTDAINGETNLLVLPEPWVSDLLSKSSDFKIAVDIQDEWTKIVGKDKPLPQSCLIVKNDIASQKNEAWNLFLKDYKDSIKWVNNNQAKTAELL